MSPQLPPEQRYWGPVSVSFWMKHYGATELGRLLLLLQRDHPTGTYRLEHGTLEVLVDSYDEDEGDE
jgi:hypothetical protein